VERFRSYVGTIGPTNGTAVHEKSFELSLRSERLKDLASEPTRKIDGFVCAIVKLDPN
jgi:hypothetical protein